MHAPANQETLRVSRAELRYCRPHAQPVPPQQADQLLATHTPNATIGVQRSIGAALKAPIASESTEATDPAVLGPALAAQPHWRLPRSLATSESSLLACKYADGVWDLDSQPADARLPIGSACPLPEALSRRLYEASESFQAGQRRGRRISNNVAASTCCRHRQPLLQMAVDAGVSVCRCRPQSDHGWLTQRWCAHIQPHAIAGEVC